jgi:23S rRNA (guanosine2251-2'-O)-methyltransferase
MSKRFHRPSEKTFVYGLHPVMEAINTGREFDKILLQKGANSHLFKELYRIIRDKDIHHQFVPEQKLNSLTSKNHQGVIAFTSLVSYVSLEEVIARTYEEGKTPLVLVLDKVTDVRNLGAIARSAECAGVDALVFPQQNSAQLNADAIKSSAGALLKLALVRSTNLKFSLQTLKDSGLLLMAATEKADKAYYETDFKVPMALIMGSEEQGISPEFLKMCDQRLKIPMAGSIDSLNVSAATAVLLFDILRQRNQE